MGQKLKIGIPRALLYHKYSVFWESFLTSMGTEIILSPETNKEIVNTGVNLSADENCLPVKLYLGHVDYLKDKVDFVFVPRIVSYYKKEYLCDKFPALCDTVKNSFPGIRLLTYTKDLNRGKREIPEIFRLGLTFTKNPLKIYNAYKKANRLQQASFKSGHVNQLRKLRKSKKSIKILIVGHPYNNYDDNIGRKVITYLDCNDVEIVYADLLDKQVAHRLSDKISSDLYWTYNKELVGAIQYFKKKVDGIIYLVTFPCGPDSLTNEVCVRRVKGVPSMSLVFDELQGDAGVRTRLESFIDIIQMRKAKENG